MDEIQIYYIDSSTPSKYNLVNVAEKGDKTGQELRTEILQSNNFCRDESSIEITDLINYMLYGITLYAIQSTKLTGVLTIDINRDVVNIRGLCAPEPSVGSGTKLLNAVKLFAQNNNMSLIKLTCYGKVVEFYKKNGFNIEKETILSDSDSIK